MGNFEGRARGECSPGLPLHPPHHREQDAEERLADGELRDAFRRELSRYEGDSISSEQLVEAVRSSNHPAIKEAMSGWSHRELRFLWAECDSSNTGYVALDHPHMHRVPSWVLRDQFSSHTRHQHIYVESTNEITLGLGLEAQESGFPPILDISTCIMYELTKEMIHGCGVRV